MADEREEQEARDRQDRTLAELRDLRNDADQRIVKIIDDQNNRSMNDLDEERKQREWVRGELSSLQRRIDDALARLR
jgi:hypothetical protein